MKKIIVIMSLCLLACLYSANAEAIGEIRSNVYTSSGKRYSFTSTWNAENSRNNKIVTTIIEIP